VPQMRYQSRSAAAVSSGPLSMRRCAGAPREATRRSTVATTPSESMRWAAWTARASRVKSSTTLSSLMRRRSAVSSKQKSNAHTSLGQLARSLAAVPSVSRRRLALRCGAVGEPAALGFALRWPLQALVAPDPPCALGVGDQTLTVSHRMGLAPPQAGMTPHGPCATPGGDGTAWALRHPRRG